MKKYERRKGKIVLEYQILELEGSSMDQIGVIGKVQGVKVLVRGKIRIYVKII